MKSWCGYPYQSLFAERYLFPLSLNVYSNNSLFKCVWRETETVRGRRERRRGKNCILLNNYDIPILSYKMYASFNPFKSRHIVTEWPTWQSRKTLSSPPAKGTLKLQPFTGQLSVRTTWTQKRFSKAEDIKKEPQWDGWERRRHGAVKTHTPPAGDSQAAG